MGYAPVSIIDRAPVPADAGTTLAVALDSGDRFPEPPFVGLVFPIQTIPTRGVDSEEVTVIEIQGDNFTIVRADDPIEITNTLQIAALRAIPVYAYREEVTFAGTFASADGPYRLYLRDPEGGTVVLDATDGGGGVVSAEYEVALGGVWNLRWQGEHTALSESSFFVRFSDVLP